MALLTYMVFSGTLGTTLERSLLILDLRNLCLKTIFRILFGGPLVFFIDRKKDAIRFVPALPKTPTQKEQKYQLRETGVTSDTWDGETRLESTR